MQKFDFTYLRYKNTFGKFIIIKNNFLIACLNSENYRTSKIWNDSLKQ